MPDAKTVWLYREGLAQAGKVGDQVGGDRLALAPAGGQSQYARAGEVDAGAANTLSTRVPAG